MNQPRRVRAGGEIIQHVLFPVGQPGPEIDAPAPFLQLAFLPLPVIPHLKITDQGLVGVDRFCLLDAL